MIEVRNLTVSFKENEVLHQVNVKFQEGKITGIRGRNGSGKTVLLKSICGLVVPNFGTILVDGKKLTIKNAHQFSMGILIEAPGFLPEYTGFQNLKFLASLTMKKKECKKRIVEVMEMVGLDWSSRKKVRGYSLGMRQRLGIAQALLENPEILILDEPMNGLDKEFNCELKKLLRELANQGKTIVVTSHYCEDLDELCDEIYNMDDGILQVRWNVL
jgi:ABC-2 type transport system ATP-binding protein